MKKRAYTLIALAMALFMALMPVAAYAQQTASLTCNNGTPNGVFYNQGTSGGGACEATGASHIVSQVICNYVLIMNDILGKVYCSMQAAFTDILQVLLTIYIAVFGIQILTGMTQLNAKEMLVRLIKIAAVWLFVTDATWGIGVAFRFFIAVMSDTIAWVINPIAVAGGVAINQTATDTMPLYVYLDNFVTTAIFGPILQANFKVIGFFVIMAHIFPAIAGIALMWFFETLLTVGRILVAFLISITALAFLIVLAPIFLSLMLFHSTFHFFDNWLRYMICYSLQITVVFAIAVMWVVVTMQFIGFFSNLSDLIVPYKQMLTEGEMQKAENDLGLCVATIQQQSTGPEMTGANCSDIIPPSKWDKQADYIYYLFYHLISLLLVAKAFKVMIQDAPKLANSIVSPGLVQPLLGGGWGSAGSRAPGLISGLTSKFPGQAARSQALRQRTMDAAESVVNQYRKALQKRAGV